MGALTPKNSVESSRNSGNTTMTSSFATVLEEALPPGEKNDFSPQGHIKYPLGICYIAMENGVIL